MRAVVALLVALITLLAGCGGDAPPAAEQRMLVVATHVPAIEIDFRAGVPWVDIGHVAGTNSIYERMAHYRIPGVGIAVVNDFTIDWAEGYGTLFSGSSDSVTTETPFEAASSTKAVVAMAILHFVGQGTIELDEDVNRQLTSWQVPMNEYTAEENVTVRRLLSHTAGINRPPGGFSIADDGVPSTVQVLNGESPATNVPLAVEFAPGAEHQYSNLGYVVLQLLLEDVAERPFAHVMQGELFDPLRMGTSTFESPATRNVPVPRPHGGDGTPLESFAHPSALAQGGLWTTPTDLGKLTAEIMRSHNGRSETVLSQETTRLALTPERVIEPGQYLGFTGQGLGVFLIDTSSGPAFCHPGFNEPGATCLLIGFPDTGQGAVVMTNGARGLELSFEILSSIAAEYAWPSFAIARTESAASSLREDFERTTFPPAGWTTQTTGLGRPYSWYQTTDSTEVGSGRGAARVGSESPSRIDEWLISPGVSLASGDDAIKFLWSGNQFWSHAVDASLNIRESGDSVWTRLWSIANNEPPADPFIYRERVVDLTSWIGKRVQFAFSVTGTDGASFAIDDIAVGDFDPTTEAPNDACANGTVLDRVFNIEGVTCYATNDLSPNTLPPAPCIFSSLNGPDVFFRFTVNPGDSLHAAVTAEWGPGIYVVDNCVDPRCIVGGYAVDARTHPIVDYRFTTPGTYYLVVDGGEGSCGPYQLNGAIIPNGGE